MMDLVEAARTHAEAMPDAPAILFRDEILTWGQLWEDAQSFACGLDRAGIGQGARVVLALDPPRFTCGLLGCLLHGAVCVPLVPQATAHELDTILAATGARLTVADDRASARLARHGPDMVSYDKMMVRQSGTPAPVDGECDGLIHFSSGSSGPPKPIPRSRLNLSLEGLAVRDVIGLTSDDVLFCTTPLQHSYAGGLASAALFAGTRVITVEDFKPARIMDMAEDHGVTILAGTPYLFSAMTKIRRNRERNLERLRLCISGGANLTSALCRGFRDAFGLPITQEYGLSEGGIATFNMHAADTKPLSCGLPIPGVELSVRDPDGRRLGQGEEGELYVKRVGMPKRYLIAGDNGSAGFPEPETTATGDIAIIDADDDLFIVGRRKMMINVAGNKVAPVEVAEILLEHPAVEDAVVVGIQDEVLGETVGAAILVNGGADPVALSQSIAEHCRKNLSRYKVPRKFAFLEDFPRLPNNKIDLCEIARSMNQE